MPNTTGSATMHMYVSGRTIDMERVVPSDITIEDIAHNLTLIPRFAGNTTRPHTVAEHSILVMQMVEQAGGTPQQMLEGLLHDAGEAYTGDIPAPVKTAVPAIREYEDSVLWPAIAEKFNLPLEHDELVKRADWVSLFVEADSLCKTDVSDWDQADEYLPMAKDWMEAFGSVHPTDMPHPSVIYEVFMNCYRAMTAAIEEGLPGREESE